MRKAGAICAGAAWVLCAALQTSGQERPSSSAQAAPVTPASSHEQSPRALLDEYCVTCHNTTRRTADLLLDAADVDDVGRDPALWERVVRKLRARQMPPAGRPRPEQPALDAFAVQLETKLDQAAASPDPGRPAIHRLNRTEYANAIRDLIALETDAEALLPSDDVGYGFDNIADVLSVSPTLVERYMLAAEKISRLAVGDPAAAPVTDTYGVPGNFDQNDRVSENLPLGSRGGVSIKHYFPVDGEYVIEVRLQRITSGNDNGDILGIDEPRQVDVRLEGRRVKLFTVGGEAHREAAIAAGKTGFKVYERTADDGLNVRVPVKAGMRQVGVTFLKDTVKPEGVGEGGERGFSREGVGRVTITGPYNVRGVPDTASRKRIFVCQPTAGGSEPACAAKILSSLARRAYRRPVTNEDLEPLLALYRSGRKQGGFDAGIRMGLRGILVSPTFLYRLERDAPGTAPGAPHPVSDLELASRLSFFIWSSIPDELLLADAERSALRDPDVLERQVRRMLADPRSKALVTNFAGQWLGLRRLRTMSPDVTAFPEFDEGLRDGFRRETELLFASILEEDRSVLDLLGADYTFLNERLARHYGIPDVFGTHFRRVQLRDEHRRGLLGQASILTVTSYPNRTSPVLRGKWVLDNILGTPPPPPPANVPDLKDRADDGKLLSVRQQMEQHRKNPVCASCHRLMDPLGFALENFDPIGRWQTMSGDEKVPVDASGVLADGIKFSGPAGLRAVLMTHYRDQFVRAFTEKLLTYALGRGVEYYDAPAVRRIIREAGADHRWSALILGIVRSTPFQMRRSGAGDVKSRRASRLVGNGNTAKLTKRRSAAS